jgi:hypothetical protein
MYQNLNICRYSYQIPAGETDHTCGSADVWSGFVNNSDSFCSPGLYCPSPIRKVSCDKGYDLLHASSRFYLNCLYVLSSFMKDRIGRPDCLYVPCNLHASDIGYWESVLTDIMFSRFRYYCRTGSTHQNRKF